SPYRTGSVIAKLAELSQRVAASTMWPVELVPWFVLTGSPPSSHAILTSIVENAGPDSPAYQIRLVLAVQPWVSHVSVRRVYRDAQRWAVGTEKRAIPEDALTRFRFVEELRRASPH